MVSIQNISNYMVLKYDFNDYYEKAILLTTWLNILSRTVMVSTFKLEYHF